MEYHFSIEASPLAVLFFIILFSIVIALVYAIMEATVKMFRKKPATNTFSFNTVDSLEIRHNTVYVNGVKQDTVLLPNTTTIRIEGRVNNVKSDINVVCEDISGNVVAGRDVTAKSVKGSVNAGRDFIGSR